MSTTSQNKCFQRFKAVYPLCLLFSMARLTQIFIECVLYSFLCNSGVSIGENTKIDYAFISPSTGTFENHHIQEKMYIMRK